MKKKNRLSRPIILSLLLILTCVSSLADRIVYTYDSGGNRTQSQKEILIRGGDTQETDSQPRNEKLSLHNITIHPNPTQGQLSVEITGTGTLEGASITIYGVSGGIIYYNSNLDAVNDIDLTLCPNGMYLLMVRVDGETSSWKIIKI